MKKIISILGLIVCVIVVGTFYSCSKKEDVTMLSSDDTSHVNDTVIDLTEELLVQKEIKSEKEIYVHICGSVISPGVYKINEETRLYELIGLAGGLTEDAMGDGVNQASLLEDGEKIYIPSIEDMEKSTFNMNDMNVETDGRINLNTATKDELMTLPGIGEAKANLIIDFRNTNGHFTTMEDIKLIPGIKDSVYNKIIDKVKVK